MKFHSRSRIGVARAFLLLTLVWSGTPAAHATTYNFYFDEGDKKKTVQIQESEVPDISEHPEPGFQPEIDKTPPRQTSEVRMAQSGFKNWVFRAGYYYVNARYREEHPKSVFDSDWEPGATEQDNSTVAKGSLVVSGSFFFTPYVGLTLHLGGVSGLDLDIVPLHWGERNQFNLGFSIGGASTSAFDASAAAVGTTLNWNISDSWGAHLSAKSSLTDESNDFSFYMVGGGATLRL